MTIQSMIKEKDYKNVLYHFCELSKTPRNSLHNEQISHWLCQFAKDHGISYVQDEALNVILKKPATPGYEKVPAVILQGHMDMVCVKEDTISHDFQNEGISLQTDGELLFANGTTLGADDGVSIAMMLSILTDETLSHPALICIITTDEEIGMNGAIAVTKGKIDANAKYFINIDSDAEGICWCSCAGGAMLDVSLPLERMLETGTPIVITLEGLSGGHSGSDIHKNIPNAIHVMGQVLMSLSEEISFRLIDFCGGEKDNSIPTFARVTILAEHGKEADAAILRITKQFALLYGRNQKNLRFSSKLLELTDANVLTKKSEERFLLLLNHMPDGVQAMHSSIPNLTETSLNLGILSMEEKEARFSLLLRSSEAFALELLTKRIDSLASLFGAWVTRGASYPAWGYKKESVLQERFLAIYRQLFQKEAKISAIHAGLECGFFCQLLPEADMISIGPNMYDIHTTKERLEIDSTIRVYQLLEHLLSEIKN